VLHKAAAFTKRSFLGRGWITVSTFEMRSKAAAENPLAAHLLRALALSQSTPRRFRRLPGLRRRFVRSPRLDPRFCGDHTCSLGRPLCTFIFARREYSDVAAGLPTVSYYKENP
jgi:hypothetical protein